MRRFGTLFTLLSLSTQAHEAHAKGYFDYFRAIPPDIALVMNIIPAGIGLGLASAESGDVQGSALLSWPMQFPLGVAGDGFQPPVRFVLEPIAAFGPGGAEFQLRAAPRVVWALERKTALFVSAGSTARFAPFEPSAHVELGLLRGKPSSLKYWVSARGDAWFGEGAEQNLAAMIGCAIY